MKKIENRQLAQLSSMSELREAQERVDRATGRIERRIKREYKEAKEQFSVKNVVYYAIDILDDAQSIFRYMAQGYRGVASIFGRRCSNRRNRRYDYEQDYGYED